MNQPRSSDQRNQRQDQTEYSPPAGPALFKAAMRGAITTAKAVMDAEIQVSQARDERERRIAETNRQNKIVESQEAQRLLQEAQQSLSEKKFEHEVSQDKAAEGLREENVQRAHEIIDEGVESGIITKEMEPHYRLGLYHAQLGGLGISHEYMMEQIEKRGDEARTTDKAKIQADAEQEKTDLQKIKQTIIGSKAIPENLKPLFELRDVHGINTTALISDALKDDDDKKAAPDLTSLPDDQRQMLLNVTNRMTPEMLKNAQNAFIKSNVPGRKTQLINLAVSKLGTEAMTATLGKWVLTQRINELADKLAEMKDAGVDINRISGSWNQLVEKLTGTTTDPLISEFKTELLVTIMNFRRAMSGAAFTESESAEYQKIFPGIASSWELNLARLSGLDNVVKSELKTTYSLLLGRGSSFVHDGVEGINLSQPFKTPATFAKNRKPTTADLSVPTVVEMPAGRETPREAPDEIENNPQWINEAVTIANENNLTEAQVRELLPQHLRDKQGITDDAVIQKIIEAVIARLEIEESTDAGEEEADDDE